jgi:hypothetical protein
MPIIADTHVHVYPEHSAGRLISGAARRLRALAATAGAAEAVPALCLTEGAGARVYETWARGELPTGWTEAGRSDDGAALRLQGPGDLSIWMVAGRQIVTRERLEILALGLIEPPPDGGAAVDVVAAVLAAGAAAVLPWGAGKWMFRRAAVVTALLKEFPPTALALGDSALRPRGLPAPAPLRAAAAEERPVLAGTDPLPMPGEEDRCGAYATLLSAAAPEPGRPAAGIPTALCGRGPRALVGARAAPLRAASLWLRHEWTRRRASGRPAAGM